jgi:uncharacterized protein (TIGR00730 family)
MKKTLCVFMGSKYGIPDDNQVISSILGNLINKNKYKLLYGGGNNGLMGVVSRAFYYSGGEVSAVTTNYFAESVKGNNVIPIKSLKKKTLLTRLQGLIDHGDVFVALPGGIGTLTEIVSVLQLNQLKEIKKPIYLVNYDGYFDKLLGFLSHQMRHGYIKKNHMNLHVFNNVLDLVKHLNQ